MLFSAQSAVQLDRLGASLGTLRGRVKLELRKIKRLEKINSPWEVSDFRSIFVLTNPDKNHNDTSEWCFGVIVALCLS